MQYSDRNMSMLSFNHHTKRKTGELLRILDRGSAINRVGEFIGFTVIPALMDRLVGVVMGSYIWASIVLARYRTRIQRRMSGQDVVTCGIYYMDCLLNYETVKYFEGRRMRRRVSLNLPNPVQTLVITSGLLVDSLIVASCITRGQSDTSDFVVFITYYAQVGTLSLSCGAELTSSNHNHDVIHTSSTSFSRTSYTERLLRLLNEPTEVVDEPDAKELVVMNGD
ncbi:hypothetical protein BDR03DRAFT_987372 [Suillus americanus]|nr:hypothetical protein BDR03DRAFT_987372 [Suillus americanus]